MDTEPSSKKFNLNTPLMQGVAGGCSHDPFGLLGHQADGSYVVFRPSAESVSMQVDKKLLAMTRVIGTDFFVLAIAHGALPKHPQLVEVGKDSLTRRYIDPYSFLPCVDETLLHRFTQGNDWQAWQLLGARVCSHQSVAGVAFAVWAPNAERVSVVGDFNQWNGLLHPMQNLGSSGIWALFIPELVTGSLYKFEIKNGGNGAVVLKSDPYGRQFQLRPDTAALIVDSEPVSADAYQWADQYWLDERIEASWLHQAISIYEVHLGSWRRNDEGGFLNYRELAHQLVTYVQALGFTHIELLPITEHPFDGSWGYQVTGWFAPTSRFGSPDDFRYFVDYCHQHNIGVILDWVPAHFPKDAHGLAAFDGTALYEHADPRQGEHRDWGTLIFNVGRSEVKNFLLSSALYWLREFHIDGLRVDAVASMLYLDYSREEGDWTPNRYGGNENLEAVEFIRTLNTLSHQHCPGAVVIAEESTSWPQVSRPVYLGGLGFSMKWNMGWMNDTLAYIEQDPVYRHYDHQKLTFGMLYNYSENFVLPLSHDEVVHGKRSILEKMPGDSWQQFANVRLLYTYLYAYPGKKLLFMGNEFAQGREWDHDHELDWHLLGHDAQRGVQKLVADLNQLYRSEQSLHQYDFDTQGFEWIDCNDVAQSVISLIRRGDRDFILIALNFTPVPRHGYRIGVPEAGIYREVLNSDSVYYGGSNVSNGTAIETEAVPHMGSPFSLVLSLPPLAAIYLKRWSKLQF